MLFKKTLLVYLLMGFVTIGNAQSKAERKKEKAEKALAAYNEFKSLVDSGSYIFKADWVTTAKGRSINIQSGNYHLKVEDGKAEGSLPYFGVSQSAGYGQAAGIAFNADTRDYKVKYNDKKRRATINMNIDAKDEKLQIIMNASAGGSSISVSSSRRNSIRYNGMITKL
ncbi:MAG: DUF4251 domain-containing protein [Maribacter sp.]|nr:DUF4251 domain-containing protein [Maribacter sp.]NND79925.1 DUF4251 domain-containing protein [Maribacter sp.]